MSYDSFWPGLIPKALNLYSTLLIENSIDFTQIFGSI